jgi:hypothetical protein
MFRFLGLCGLRARIQFGDEVVERADRFVLSETAQGVVAEIYGNLDGAIALPRRRPTREAPTPWGVYRLRPGLPMVGATLLDHGQREQRPEVNLQVMK